MDGARRRWSFTITSGEMMSELPVETPQEATPFIGVGCRLVSFDAESLYTHPFVEGLLLRPITSKTQLDLAKGVLFFDGVGEAAFGCYGSSYDRFLRDGNWYTASTNGSAKRNTNPVWAVPKGSTENVCVVNYSASVFEKVTTNDVRWDEETMRCTWGTCAAMEIIAFNCDDGQFAILAGYGGGITSSVLSSHTYSNDIPVGWMRKRVELGEIGRGLIAAHATMTHGMKKDELKYFNRAYNNYMNSSAARRRTTANIVTSFVVDRSLRRAMATTGLTNCQLYAIPSATGRYGYHSASGGAVAAAITTTHMPQQFRIVVVPVVVPCSDPTGTVIVSDIKTGHLLAEAADYDSNQFRQIVATGDQMDQALSSVGVTYQTGVPDAQTTSSPFPLDIDLDGLPEEQRKGGWQSIDTQAGSKSDVATLCRHPYGISIFAELHDAVTAIYDSAVSLAKKDAKKKGVF